MGGPDVNQTTIWHATRATGQPTRLNYKNAVMQRLPKLTDHHLPGLVYGELTVTKPPAAANQMVHSKLVNRKPIVCAVCERYISPFTGLPVILDDKDQIIEFAHPACCRGSIS